VTEVAVNLVWYNKILTLFVGQTIEELTRELEDKKRTLVRKVLS